MAKRINIKEIAEKAEVSIGTVDRVLHNRGRVAEATKEKVLKIAKEGNYTSNVYARNLKLNRTYTIAVLLPDDNPFWDKHKEGISRGILEYEAMGFTQHVFKFSNLNELARTQSIERALNSDPDGLILAPTMLAKGGKSVELLSQSKVPYVFLDSTIDGLNNLAFISQKAFQSGKMAGSLLSNPYSSDYALWVVIFSKSDEHNETINSRIKGLMSFYEDKKDIEVFKINLENEEMNLIDLKNRMIAMKKSVHVFIPNSKSSQLIMKLQDTRQQTNMRVVGYDLIEGNVNCLKNGLVDYIIDQQPIKQGFLAVEALYRHLILKTTVQKEQYLPLDIITKENIMYCDY